jgi:hypothetical protein
MLKKDKDGNDHYNGNHPVRYNVSATPPHEGNYGKGFDDFKER